MTDASEPTSRPQSPPNTLDPAAESGPGIAFDRNQLARMSIFVVGLALFAGVSLAVRQVLLNSGDPVIAKSAEFTLWAAMIGAMVTVYAAVFVLTMDLARRWRGAVQWAAAVIILYLCAAAAVFTIWHFSATPTVRTPLISGTQPISYATFFVALAGLAPTALGLGWEYSWLRYVLVSLRRQVLPGPAGKVASGLMDARRTLQRCLVAMSAAISITVVGSGALRNAWLAHGVQAKTVPSSGVLLFGALFTAAFALAYVPAFLTWRHCTDSFVEIVYPMPSDARPSEEWASGRTRLQLLIGSDNTIGKNFVAAFGILAPLATSILGIFIPQLVNRGA